MLGFSFGSIGRRQYWLLPFDVLPETPDCPGDGTVPVYSGEAPGLAGLAMSFAHGHGNPGRHNVRFCYDHQGSYGDDRALYATMYAIIKIAQKAQWHKA